MSPVVVSRAGDADNKRRPRRLGGELAGAGITEEARQRRGGADRITGSTKVSDLLLECARERKVRLAFNARTHSLTEAGAGACGPPRQAPRHRHTRTRRQHPQHPRRRGRRTQMARCRWPPAALASRREQWRCARGEWRWRQRQAGARLPRQGSVAWRLRQRRQRQRVARPQGCRRRRCRQRHRRKALAARAQTRPARVAQRTAGRAAQRKAGAPRLAAGAPQRTRAREAAQL